MARKILILIPAVVASFALTLFLAVVLEWRVGFAATIGMTPLLFWAAWIGSSGQGRGDDRRDEVASRDPTIGSENVDKIRFAATDPTGSEAAWAELRERVDAIDGEQVRRAARDDPRDVAAQCALADLEIAADQVDAGLGRLLAVVRGTSGADRERARVHLLSLFAAVGPTDPRVVAARWELASRLH